MTIAQLRADAEAVIARYDRQADMRPYEDAIRMARLVIELCDVLEKQK